MISVFKPQQMPGIRIENVFVNLLKPTGYVMHQQVEHSTIVRSANTVFIYFLINPFRDLCHYNLATGTNKQSYCNLND